MNIRGHALKAIGKPWPFFALLAAALTSVPAFASSNYAYSDGEKLFPYSVASTGENYSFEFLENPGNQGQQLKAASHVLQSVYGDASINPRHTGFFTKENAKCFVFDANFHTYTSCFLPNEYSPGNENRFWGFVTRVPNGLWLITRNLVPALLLIGGFLYFSLRKKRPGGMPGGGETLPTTGRAIH